MTEKYGEKIYVVVREDRYDFIYQPIFWSNDLDLVHTWIAKNESSENTAGYISFTYYEVQQLLEF